MKKPKELDRSAENKFTKNYAADIGTAERWFELVKGIIPETRENRRQKENLWLEDDRQWACNLTDSQMYMGRSNLQIPEYFHQVENTVSKYVNGMFPSLDYIGVKAINGTDEDTAEAIKAAVFDQLHYRNHAPVLFDRHGRQRTKKGTSVLRPRFIDKEVDIFTREKNKVVRSKIPLFRGVKWELVDMYRWYIAPEWGTMDEYFCIFEDDWILKRDLKSAMLNGKPMYTNVDEVREISGEYDYHYWIDTQRLYANTIAQAATERPHAVFITTVHMDFDIEDNGEWVPCVGYIGNNNTVLRLARNPLWFQKAPYVVGRYVRWESNNFYGLSLSDRLRSLCRWQTDLANQTMDSVTYALNPIAIIDPALAGDVTSFVQQPGARWFGSPQGIEFKSMTDVSPGGWAAMSQLRNMISQFSDNSTGIAPQLTGKARSATQASFVDKEVTKDLRASMMNEEFDVMIPMCHMTHSMLKQYQNKPYQIKVQGPEQGQWIMKDVNPEDLEGEVDFEWRGSSVEEENAVRTQQLMGFFQMCVQSANLPGVQGKVDFPNFIMKIAKETFKLDHLEDFLIDVRDSLTVDPETENVALLDEMDIKTHNKDDDAQHMKIHSDAYGEAKTEEQKLAILKHNERHRVQKAAKDKMAQLQAQQQQLQGSMEGMGGQGQPPQAGQSAGGQPQGQPGQGPQGPFQGNLSQMPQNPSSANLTRGIRGAEGNL